MFAPLTAAEAWCWTARMLSKESDELYYSSHVKTEAMLAECDALTTAANAAHARATKLGADGETWKSAMRKWDNQASLQSDEI